MLGFLSARSHHGWRNVNSAVTWYKKAAEINNAAAINALGVMYFKGDKLPLDLETAISHFERATKLGDMFAPYNLARCYEQGIGVEQNEKLAIDMFLVSIDRYNEYAGDYFETKFFQKHSAKKEVPETEDTFGGYVFAEEMNESYRRECMYKLPELIIME